MINPIEENILVIDTETTGTKAGTHAMIECAAVLYEKGIKTKTYQFQQPVSGQTVDLEALKYNGVSIEKLQWLKTNFQNMETHFGGFIDFLLKLPKNTVVCGHNVGFDIDFIKSELERHGLDNLGGVLPYKVYDTKGLAMFLRLAGKLNTEGTSVHHLAKALDIPYKKEDLHTAIGDAELTGKIFFAMLDLVSNLVPGSPLH